MKWSLLLVVAVFASLSGCNGPSDAPPTLETALSGEVVFLDGDEIDSRDHGRPVNLIAAALDVPPETFRDAFSGVSPSKFGPPTPGQAKANKKVLMDALGKHGVSNDRLDEVSNYYRYNRAAGETWKRTPASAVAQITNGQITGIQLTNAGSGYSSVPTVTIAGYEDVQLRATIEYSTDFAENGRVTSIRIVDSNP